MNRKTPKEIVQSIVSGSTSKPPRHTRKGAKEADSKSLFRGVKRLQNAVNELQALVGEKDVIIASLQEQLQGAMEENRILRSNQVVPAAQPPHDPSVAPQHSSCDITPQPTASGRCFNQGLPSSLIPTVGVSSRLQELLSTIFSLVRPRNPRSRRIILPV